MQTKLDPEVKKAIWKIVIYAVTILGSLFAGNVAAKNGIHFIKPSNPTCYVQSETQSNQIC